MKLRSHFLVTSIVALTVLLSPVKRGTISNASLGENEQVKQTIESALGDFLKRSKDFNINTIESNGNTATGTMTLFKTSAKYTVSYGSASQLQKMEVVYNSKTEFNRSSSKKVFGKQLSNFLPKNVKTSAVSTVVFDFENSSTIRKASAIVRPGKWKIIDGSPLQINNPIFTVTASNPSARRPSVSSSVTGKVNFGNVLADITGSGSSSSSWNVKGKVKGFQLGNLLSAITNKGSTGGIPMPSAVSSIGFTEMDFTIVPSIKKLTGNGTTEFGKFAIHYTNVKSTAKYQIGFQLSPQFRFSSLDPSMGFIDGLKLSNAYLALSSMEQKPNLSLLQKFSNSTILTRGLNLLASYDLNNLSPEFSRFTGVKQVFVQGTVSNRPTDMMLLASIDTKIPFDNQGNVVFERVKMRLRPSDLNMALNGEISVKAGADRLTFVSGMTVDVDALEFTLQGQMKGMWSNPFKLSPNVHISDLGLQIGASFRTLPVPIPSLRMQGKLKTGPVNSPVFQGEVAVGLVPYDPMKSMIDARFNHLSLGQIVKALSGNQRVPTEIMGALNKSKITGAELTMVPGAVPVELFGKYYNPGFLIKGAAQIIDFKTNLLVRIAQGSVEANASVDPINLSPVFTLKGVGKPKPYFEMLVKPGVESRLSISGEATLLGLTSRTEMHIRNNGYDLATEGEIFKIFKATLDVHTNKAFMNSSYSVKATLQNDLHKYLTEKASKEIDKATEATRRDITAAQATLTKEQNKVKSLNTQINNRREAVKAGRERDCGRVRAAEAVVERERQKVLNIQRQIDAEIKARQAKRDQVKAKKEWWKEKKLERQIAFNSFQLKMEPQIAAHTTKIASLETAKGTANAALLAARESLKLIAHICDVTPIDSDPQIASLISARDIAYGSMEAAKAIMEGSKIIGVGTLQGSKWIIENGNPLGVVNITYASFEGALSSAKDGKVQMQVKGTYAGKPIDMKFGFNFKSPLESAKELARILLK